MSWSPRTGGFAGLSAAGLLVLSAVLYAISPVDGEPDTWRVYQTVVLAAYLAVLGAIAGIHAAHRGRRRYGWVGTAAAWGASAGYAVVAAVSAIGMVRDVDSLFGVRVTGAALVLVGSAVLGVVVLVARVLPRWCGVLLIVAFPLGDVADAVFPTGEGLVLAVLWGSVGVALLSLAPDSRRPPSWASDAASGSVLSQGRGTPR